YESGGDSRFNRGRRVRLVTVGSCQQVVMILSCTDLFASSHSITDPRIPTNSFVVCKMRFDDRPWEIGRRKPAPFPGGITFSSGGNWTDCCQREGQETRGPPPDLPRCSGRMV